MLFDGVVVILNYRQHDRIIMTMSKTHFKVQKKIAMAMHYIVTSKGSIRGTRWEINHRRVSQCGPSRLLPTNMKHSRHCLDIDTGLRHCSNWKSTIPFRVYVLLYLQAFVDIHAHFVRLTAPMTWVNDQWSDDRVGTEVIRCRS